MPAAVPPVPNETTETPVTLQHAGQTDTATVPPVSNGTNKTRRGATYRAIGKILGVSASTVWRDTNRGRTQTITQARREARISAVCLYRAKGLSIRQIASTLDESRGTVERDLRLIQQVQARGGDVVSLAYRTLEAWKQRNTAEAV
jgi:transposase